MESKLNDIAIRLQCLREDCDFTVEDMAEACSVSVEEYKECEAGMKDFSVTFLCNCAKKFGIDMIELMTGEKPRLTTYEVVRAGKGLAAKRRSSFKYEHLAFKFKDKITEPFLVEAPYSEAEQTAPIHLSSHEGFEFDYILSGSLKINVGDHVEILNAGDSIYYNSTTPHGMIAVGGEKCVFLAFVMPTNRGKE